MAVETTIAKSITLGVHFSKTNVRGSFGFWKKQPIPPDRGTRLNRDRNISHYHVSIPQTNYPAMPNVFHATQIAQELDQNDRVKLSALQGSKFKKKS